MSNTHLEDFIQELYISMEIYIPTQLNIDDIANKLNLHLYSSDVSFIYGNKIVLKETSYQKKWQTFGHELCHYLRHYGNQTVMNQLFVELQENQANYFSLHFCVPTFMLNNLKKVDVHVIMRLFNVEYDFAERRLEMYQNKVCERMSRYALRRNKA